MNKLMTTSTVGLAGLVASGLVAWQAPMAFGDDGRTTGATALGQGVQAGRRQPGAW